MIQCPQEHHRALARGPREEWIAGTLPLATTGERSILGGILEQADCATCSTTTERATISRWIACYTCGAPVDGPKYCAACTAAVEARP